jgi:tetratricopeptide (TPR) repeat protein
MDAKEAKSQGNAAFRSGNFDEAVRCYSVALAAGANHQVLSNRSASYLALGHYTEVRMLVARTCTHSHSSNLQHHSRTARSVPPTSSTHVWTRPLAKGASMVLRHGAPMIVQALADAEACVKQAPAWVKGHYRMGNALMQLQRLPAAMQCFERVMQLDPDNEEAVERLNTLRAVLAPGVHTPGPRAVTSPKLCAVIIHSASN